MAQRHMDRLTSFDTSFLANEKSNGHMAIGAVLMCEGSAPSEGDFLAHIRSRVHQLPRLRQRLLYPPLGLGTPFWVDHREFDIHQHLRRVTLPAPGGEAQFRALVGELLAPPLDRRKPLWELIVVEGFEDDRFAIVYKTHHAMADGISAVDIGMLLFDVEPRTEPAGEEAPWEPARSPSKLALAWHAGTGIVATLRRLARWLRRALEEPGRARRRALDGLTGVWEVTWNLVRPAPKVPFNTAIGAGRSFCWSTFQLVDFKRVKNALGGTVNDVSLTAVAGALRRWLIEREVPVDGLELKALVPVSIRTENEHGELGNKLTAMRGPLPVGVADPVERLHAVSVGDGRPQGLQAAARRGSDLGPQRLVPGLRAAGPARPNRGDQLLDSALQPAGDQLPRPAGPLLRARARADRDLPGRLPRPQPRPGDRDPQLQRPGRLRPARRPRLDARRGADRRPPRRRRRGAPRAPRR